MNQILNHAKTDPNAQKHMYLGITGSAILFAITVLFQFESRIVADPIIPILIGLIFFCLGGFITGIGIELVQRVQRIGKKQNTLKESFLDVMVTGCWPLIFFIGKEH